MRTIEGPIAVSRNSRGDITEWHRLTHEEPFTVWRGGTLAVPHGLSDMHTLERK